MIEPRSPDLLARFAQFDSGIVADALENCGLAGVMEGLHRLTTDKAIAGYAETVQLAPDDHVISSRHLCTAAIDSATSNSVIVVAGGRLDCGGWGGLLSRAAAHKGVRGAIVDGATRDVDDANEIGFPVFARGSAAPTARGRQREIASGITVEIGTVAVSPGDLVIADGTGVVVVRYVNIEEVLSAAQVIFAKEQAMAQRIADGEPVTAVLSREYESMVAVKEGDR